MALPWETIPPDDHVAITPSANAVANGPFRALVIGGAGTVTVTSKKGTSVTYTVQAGQTIIIQGTHVTAATATGIVAQF